VRALVTGSAGFIGSHVAEALVARGDEVVGFDRAPTDMEGVSPVVGDLLDADAVARAAEGCEAVFHLAAIYSYARRDAARMLRVNVESTRNVLAAAARAGARRVVATSSCSTCGPVPGRPATEDDAPPDWELGVAYKRSKIEAEAVALSAARDGGQDVVVVNPTTPVGPRDRRPTPTGAMVRDVARGRIRAFVRTAINVVAVQDVAAGHLLAFERGRAGERYLLGGEDLELQEAFAIIARHAGRRPPRAAVPFPVALGAAWVADRATRLVGREPGLLNLDETRLARTPMRFSDAKARRELGYVSRPADEALAGAVSWFSSNGQT
jgi:dihydroflavonol-4-reductase